MRTPQLSRRADVGLGEAHRGAKFASCRPRGYHQLKILTPSDIFAYTAFEGATVKCVSDEVTENNVRRPAMIQAEIGKRVLTRILGDHLMAISLRCLQKKLRGLAFVPKA